MSFPLVSAPGRRCLARHFPMFLFLFVATPSARAVITETITDVDYEAPTVLIDSDLGDGLPNTIKNGLETNVEVTVARTSALDPAVNRRYRVVSSLEDSAGDQLDLDNGDPGNIKEVTSPVFVVSLAGFPFAPNSHVEQLKVSPDPVATLDPGLQYRVLNRLEQETAPNVWSIVDDTPTTDGSLTNILHFTNTVSGDPEFNVRGLFFVLNWERQYLVDTQPSKDALLVNASAIFGRYDDYDDPVSPQAFNAIFDFDLLDSSNNSVPLVDDGIVVHPLVLDSYDDSGPANFPPLMEQSSPTSRSAPSASSIP